MKYNTLVMVTPDTFNRLKKNYTVLSKHLKDGLLCFVGSKEVGRLVSELEQTGIVFLHEDEILPFDEVYTYMSEHLAGILQGTKLPRGMVGWYYQQFLKMQYARVCEDEYYMAWDGDTIPCRDIPMFDEVTGKPYMDLKKEYHREYFDTIKLLFGGMEKAIEESYISEHMLINTRIMKDMLEKIEQNDQLSGGAFWQRIISCIEPEKIKDTAFSEFETYGTFCHYYYPDTYQYRRWHSFRLGAEFFDPDTISDGDYEWIGHDFSAISFEKNQSVRSDHKDLFDNPYYQSRLTARQMLEIVQQEFGDGYKEEWEEKDPLLEKINSMEQLNTDTLSPSSSIQYLADDTWMEYESLGDALAETNADQAFLCYENAHFLCADEKEKSRLLEKKDSWRKNKGVKVQKAAILILSRNGKYLTQRCVESILSNCCPDSYSLIVLDNASTDGSAEWLKNQKDADMTLLLSDENQGFPAGCNTAAGYASQGEDIFLLNNDTRVPANALFWLRMGLYEGDQIGAVGGMQNYTGTGQRIDAKFSVPEEYMRFGAENNIKMDEPWKEAQKLSGFAMLIKRKIWDEEKGFDERFSPGYFEDDDLCERIRRAGYQLKICKNAFIYHVGSQAFTKEKKSEELLLANRQKFIEKWGYEITEEEQ
ncbi:MAG: glycosyltransferase family 2 protein [Lachnospiraceae bacterium]|nr:glycosyltransferase family 2 protein [Lachnospiraceae bacterium]